MKTQTLLAALKTQIEHLEQRVLPLSDNPFELARFDRSLFNHRSIKLGDCLDDIRKHYDQLCHSVSLAHSQQVVFLAEKIVCQIQALSREISTQPLRDKETQYSQKKSNIDLYERLTQHQGYERRLVAMIDDRELTLNQQTNPAQRHKLQQEIAALAGRLYRCRLALQRIDKSIEQQESLYHD